MELDARLLITLGGMLLSVASSFIVTRQKCLQLEEDSKQMHKNITELYDNLEKNNISTEVAENRVAIISQILSPENREKLHRSLERMETQLKQDRKDLDKILAMHNGSHPIIKTKD